MIRKVAAIFALCIFIFSCSTQHVVSDHAIQKRKYRPGLFVSKKSKTTKLDQATVTVEPQNKEAVFPSSRSNNQVIDLDTTPIHADVQHNEEDTFQTETEEQKVSDPLALPNRIIAKFVPMQYANGITKQFAKLSVRDYAEDDDEGTSMASIIGCALGGAAIASFLSGLMTVEIGFGIYLLALSLAIAIAGMIFSIKGAIESGRTSVKGTVLSIIGMITNGVIVIMGMIAALIAFIIVGIFVGCNS